MRKDSFYYFHLKLIFASSYLGISRTMPHSSEVRLPLFQKKLHLLHRFHFLRGVKSIVMANFVYFPLKTISAKRVFSNGFRKIDEEGGVLSLVR